MAAGRDRRKEAVRPKWKRLRAAKGLRAARRLRAPFRRLRAPTVSRPALYSFLRFIWQELLLCRRAPPKQAGTGKAC